MAMNVTTVKRYISNGMNILVTGEAGTGKTTIFRKACAELGLTMKYYSTPTLDPYTELIGVPVPQNDTKTIEFYRPREIDEAEVIFFDEPNRADPRILNALFEIIQFGTINGEPLPKLKVVVAAINPDTEGYTVDELDIALLDRFDVYLTSEPAIEFAYFKEKFGHDVATAAKRWWDVHHRAYTAAKNHSSNDALYISPRRMEKMVSAFIAIPTRSTLMDTLPVNGPRSNVNISSLMSGLEEAIAASHATPASAASAPTTATVAQLLKLTPEKLRANENVDKINAIVSDSNIPQSDRHALLQSLAIALNKGVGGQRLVERYHVAVEHMTQTHYNIMTDSWSFTKKASVEKALENFRKSSS